jgi:hypothetical protein
MVREIIPINPQEIQQVSGRATMVVREEVLPVRSLADLIGWPQPNMPAFGVLMQTTVTTFILAIDGFVGRDDVVIKPLHDIKPKGIAGATLSGDGLVVLVLDMEELLSMSTGRCAREGRGPPAGTDAWRHKKRKKRKTTPLKGISTCRITHISAACPSWTGSSISSATRSCFMTAPCHPRQLPTAGHRPTCRPWSERFATWARTGPWGISCFFSMWMPSHWAVKR